MDRRRFALAAVSAVTLARDSETQDPAKRGPGPRPIHDPSTIVKFKDEYWLFATGRGVATWRSKDLKVWTPGPPALGEAPAWATTVTPGFRGGFWAPDVVEVEGRYLLYYSVSTFGKNASAIGLASNPALDPADPRHKWTDHGVVIQSTAKNDFNAIDPGVFRDADGTLWMAFGSFWSGIKLVELDSKSGLKKAGASLIGLANKEQIEAAAIHRRGEDYFLFVNWGWCCRGLRSTYEIRVGRSKKVVGPYLDREGVDLRRGGGTRVLETEGRFIGPGHPAVFNDGKRDLLSYHYYDGDRRGRSDLGIRELEWDEKGWPKVTGNPPLPLRTGDGP